MTSLPPTTRRFLTALRSHPERYGRVMAHLYELRSHLVHGTSVQYGPARTDWWRIREIALVLHAEARHTNIREAVALFNQLRVMAEQALEGLHQTTIHELMAA